MCLGVSVLMGFADLTGMTLADEDTNPLLTDNTNGAIPSGNPICNNVAMKVAPPGGQNCK